MSVTGVANPRSQRGSRVATTALPDGPKRRMDAVSVLSIFVVALFGLPGHLIVPALGAIGTPAVLAGMICAWWWTAGRTLPQLGFVGGPQPVRTALLAHGWYMVLAFVIAWFRPLDGLEVSASNRALLTLLALSGVGLVAADGIPSRARLDVLVRRVVAGGAFVAVIGIVQFFAGFDPMRYVSLLPGLSLNHTLVGVGSRSIFNRPYGTTLHPIEFGVILGALLPLALHVAFTAPAGRSRRRAQIAMWLIATGIPLSISRSGIVALVAGLLAVVAAWSWRTRANAAIAGFVFTVVMWAAVPGLLGTIRGLFVGLENDPSITARTERIPKIVALFSESPWFGRGYGTFSIESYFLVDNEWYVSAIEVGLIGVAVIVGLFIVAMFTARHAGRLRADPTTKQLGYAIAASLFAMFATIGTFDAFFYRIFTGMMFLLIGCAGALWRLERAAGEDLVRTAHA